MTPMNRFIVPIILALGFINWIVQRCTHSLRINQTYDLWGGAIFTIVQIVLQGCNFFAANPFINPGSIKICRLFFAAFWLLLWIVSVQGWMRFSECDFSMRAECMGKYGIGARQGFTKDGQQALIFYPVQKSLYEAAIKVESNRAPYVWFGDKFKAAMVDFENQVFGASLGEWHGYTWPKVFTIDAWLNAPYDADLTKLIPIIWHHGFAANNEFYTA